MGRSSSNIQFTIILTRDIQFVGDRVKALRVLNQEGKLDECDKVPMLHRLLKHSYSKDTPMPDRDVISEAMGHM